MHCLHEGQGCFGHKGQDCFSLKLPEVKVGHALDVVLEHSVAVVGVTDEHVSVAGRVLYRGAQLLKLLQWDDHHNSAHVQPHLFESSEQATQVHPAQFPIAVADEPTCLLPQIQEEIQVRSAGLAGARVDVHVVEGKDASHSLRLLLNEPVAIVGQEQAVFLVPVVDIEVLDACVQQLELGALVPVVRSAAVPAVDLTLVGAVPLWTT